MTSTSFKDRNLLAVIGDEVGHLSTLQDITLIQMLLQDTVTGLLLAGIGHITQQQKKNFLVVDSSSCLYPVTDGG